MSAFYIELCCDQIEVLGNVCELSDDIRGLIGVGLDFDAECRRVGHAKSDLGQNIEDGKRDDAAARREPERFPCRHPHLEGGVRQFLADEQCDQEKIERIMADQPKP